MTQLLWQCDTCIMPKAGPAVRKGPEMRAETSFPDRHVPRQSEMKAGPEDEKLPRKMRVETLRDRHIRGNQGHWSSAAGAPWRPEPREHASDTAPPGCVHGAAPNVTGRIVTGAPAAGGLRLAPRHDGGRRIRPTGRPCGRAGPAPGSARGRAVSRVRRPPGPPRPQAVRCMPAPRRREDASVPGPSSGRRPSGYRGDTVAVLRGPPWCNKIHNRNRRAPCGHGLGCCVECCPAETPRHGRRAAGSAGRRWRGQAQRDRDERAGFAAMFGERVMTWAVSTDRRRLGDMLTRADVCHFHADRANAERCGGGARGRPRSGPARETH